jgi:hypothetical protein
MTTSVSEFERRKPRKTHKAIQKLISKYRNVIMNMEIIEEEDCIKIEMADVFVKELEGVMKLFKKGE